MKNVSLLLVLIFTSLSVKSQTNSQTNSIPDGQVLYLDFNNNTNDQSGNNNVVTNQNVSFTTDRNNTSNAAANFGGCGTSPAYLKVNNSNTLQITNALTINFWAKVDLSTGMNPADGTCSNLGHHILFAKGGDGYGTAPNGIYTKLEPNGSNATNYFGSSPNSGNLAYSSTVNNPNSWNFYSYVITTTEYKFYINGILQTTNNHTFNFNEVNNEDLYIGILGPKTTPALGITNWYPLKGQLDEFRVFNRELNISEIQNLYTEVQGAAPAISAVYYLGDSYYFSSAIQYYTDVKDFNFSNEDVLLVNNYGRYGNYTASIIKYDQVSVVKKNYSSNNRSDAPEKKAVQKHLLKNNNKYYNFINFPNVLRDSLFIHDSSLNVVKKTNLGNIIYWGSFIKNSQLIILNKVAANTALFYIKIYSLEGDFQSQIIIQDEINDYAFDNNRLVLVSNSKFYTFNADFSNYAVNLIGGKKIKLASDNIILTSEQGAWVYNLANQTLTILSNLPSQCFISEDNLKYYILSNGYLTKYSSSNTVVYSKQIPVHSDIKYQKDYFLFINKILATGSSGTYNINLNFINSDGNIIYQSNYSLYTDWQTEEYSYNGNINFKVLPNQNILIVESSGIIKINPAGNILWKKNIKARQITVNNDNSFWIVSAERLISLSHVQNESNRCVYEVENPFASEYCPPSNDKLHQILPDFKGDMLKTGPISKAGIGTIPIENLGFSYEWYKDNQLITDRFLGEFRGNGNYKLKIKQGDCSVESETKYVSYSSTQNPVQPTLSIDKNTICLGKSAIISSTCTDATLKWTDGFQSGNTRTTTPTVSTTYIANCEKSWKKYQYVGSPSNFIMEVQGATCLSDYNTIGINVYNANSTSNLNGHATAGTEYKSGKITSSQTIPTNQRNQYKFIKSAELNASFSAAHGSTLTIEAEQGCTN